LKGWSLGKHFVAEKTREAALPVKLPLGFSHPIVSVRTKIGQPAAVCQVWRNAARKLVPADVRFFEVGECTELDWDPPIKLIVPQQRNCKIEVLADWHGYLARKKIVGERQRR
jgi:hypothetical protein